MMDREKLIELAVAARRHTYSPYSHYAVGAAVLAADGNAFIGTNVENASFGLTICAERVALFSAIAHGRRRGDFVEMVVVTGNFGTSCGSCRQVLYELAPYMPVTFVEADATGKVLAHETITVRDLLPEPFDLGH